jgi:CRISPR-associated protein Cmr6
VDPAVQNAKIRFRELIAFLPVVSFGKFPMPTLQEQLIQKGLAPEQSQTKNPKKAQSKNSDTDNVPRMYRAQVKWRCSLQYIDSDKRKQNTQKDQDLEIWLQEWLYPALLQNEPSPKLNQPPSYCQLEANSGLDGSIYRILVDFPFRLFSNCGQDSIHRPVLGKQGIPCLPGSSVKGLFRRACEGEQVQKYCGNRNNLIPSTSGLRFHAAYPIGNWGNRILDVVYPQENYQVVGSSREKYESAHPLISLYKPQMLFEFSTPDSKSIDWDEVKQILQRALGLGVGGKTSTGYGGSGYLSGQTPSSPTVGSHHRQFRFSGDGLSSKLLTQESEFRPNLFKATLRSHARRLLAGASGAPRPMDAEVDRLFGCTEAPGVVQIGWQPTKMPNDEKNETTYHAEGILHLSIDSTHPEARPEQDMPFALQLLRFAYIMGGFGKSWRRVWHHQFYPGYYQQGANKYPIGCHWVSPDIESLSTSEELREFLNELHRRCCDRLRSRATHPLPWRESWHPDRLAIYCKPLSHGDTTVIELFHDDIFKTTPAIGGKNFGDSRPTSVSSVWHRMLPIGQDGTDINQYLEIVTVFYGRFDSDRTPSPWQHRNQGDQLQPFINQLTNSMSLAWGNPPGTIA